MSFTFSNLAQAVFSELGKSPPLHQFVATGGSTITIENSAWLSREDAPEDDYCKDWTAIIVRDAGGLGASPEGRMARITAYASSAGIYTMDTVTDAVTSGDAIMIANSDIPIAEMLRAANSALQDFGEVQSESATLTMATGTYRYLLPAGINRDFPIRVEYEDVNYKRIPLEHTVSADGYLHIPYPVDGKAIHITSVGPHAQLMAYNSIISEDIHPALVIVGTAAYAMQWLNGTQGGGTAYNIQRENKAWADIQRLRIEHPVKKYPRQPRWFEC